MERSFALSRHHEEKPRGNGKPVVLLCLQNRADSELIREYLTGEYIIITLDAGQRDLGNVDFDLCIADRHTFDQHREWLLDYKESKAPVIVPFLLFVRSDTWMRTIDPAWNEVDDVIPMPIPRPVLLSRVKSLLKSRSYSLELKQKNEKLRIYEQAIHATNTGVIITDARKEDNPIIFANKGFEELTGYEQDEILGRNCRFLQGEERGQEARTAIRSFIDAGREGHSLIRNYRKDGTPFWNELSIAPIRNNNGETTHFVGIQNDVTELVETRASLQEEKEFMSTVMNLLPNMFFMVDSGMNFSIWNAAFEQILGYSEEEIRKMSPVDFFPAQERNLIQAKIKEVYESGEAEMEAGAITKDGRLRRLYAIGKRFERDGETYIIGSAIDITERAEAEYQLQERIKEQRCLYDISSLIEQKHSIDELLREAVHILARGYQYPEIAEAAIVFNDREYATEGFRETEWMLKANGIEIEDHSLTLKVVYLQEKPEQDEGPFLKEERELIDAVADSIASQIERIIALDKLRESESRWKTLVSNDPDLVMILDEMEVRFINEGGARMYGTDNPDELIGRNMFDLVEVKEAEYAKARLQQVLTGEAVDPVVHTVTAPDGRVRMLEVQSLPVTYQGKPAIQVVGRDITERMHYERKLQNSLEEKEVLLQEIHHRVKNNLAVISSMLQIQQLNSDDEKLNSILANSELRVKSIALIHEKLYQSESFSDIGFRNYIEDLVKAIRATNKTEKDISVLLECQDISLNVNQALPCALILNELITNAMVHAFTESRKGLIRVILREENENIFVKIEDNGIGLPDDFDERSRSMGYTIIKTLIAQLQAEFSLSNRLDGGTHAEFSFEKRNMKGSTSTLV